MSTTVLATDILPSLYDNDDDMDTRESHEDVVDDLNYDIYNLAAFNYHPIKIPAEEDEREEAILEAATRATQLLIKRCVIASYTKCHYLNKSTSGTSPESYRKYRHTAYILLSGYY